jgi:serine/threonine protein phosphatase 1
MRRFAIGDIHGSFRALEQCLERSKADINNDRFIVVGDVCDGWPEVKESVDLLLSMKNCIFILGNHDEWALDWMKTGRMPDIWTQQGGKNTIRSYNWKGIPDEHIRFFEKAPIYHIEDRMLFIHGGIKKRSKVEENDRDMILWDRSLAEYSWQCSKFKDANIIKPHYDKVFIGHTTTEHYGSSIPICGGKVWNLDTGAGWNGKLTIMDIDTEEYWQSDNSNELYVTEKGRP